MKRWEYLFLTAEKFEKIWMPRFVDGQEISGWDTGLTLYDYANHLGSDGWELISVNWQAKENMTHHRFVFKRKQ